MNPATPHPTTRRTRGVVALAAAAALLLAACGDDGGGDSTASDSGPVTTTSAPATDTGHSAGGPEALLTRLETSTDDASAGIPVTHVGPVEGTQALVAIAEGDDGSVVAYLCDGAAVSAWYTATATGGSAELTTDGDGGPLTIDGVGTHTITGTVTIDGTEHGFTAEQAETGGDVLYRLVQGTGDDALVTGWILHDDTLRGATRKDRAVAGTASVDDIGVLDDTGTPPPGDDAEATFRLFPKLRCRHKANKVVRTPTSDAGAWNDALQDFLDFGCSTESFLPGLGLDSTDNLCLLFGVENCNTIK